MLEVQEFLLNFMSPGLLYDDLRIGVTSYQCVQFYYGASAALADQKRNLMLNLLLVVQTFLLLKHKHQTNLVSVDREDLEMQWLINYCEVQQ